MLSTLHRIECRGFIVREKKNVRKVLVDKTVAHSIPFSFFRHLQKGEDFISESGEVIKNDTVTIENTEPRSYAFAADTIFNSCIADAVSNVNVLYHEATYPHALHEKAKERFHSTTKEAATTALQANVQRLLIGHFSAKFEDLNSFEQEAREVFTNTDIAKEGVTYLV